MNYECETVADDIVENIFGVNSYSWMSAKADAKAVEHFLFTEVYSISLSGEVADRCPEALDILVIYPIEFIRAKVKEAAQDANYFRCKSAFEILLGNQDDGNQLYILRRAIYILHVFLLKRDFGDSVYSLDSECRGLTREAEDFMAARGD